MAYDPVVWKDNPQGGTPITAADLNRMEQTIAGFDKVLSGFTTIVTSWNWNGNGLATPGPKQISGNKSQISTSTVLAINDLALDDRNFTGLMRMITTSSRLYIQKVSNPDAWVKMNVTNSAVHTGDYTKFNCSTGGGGSSIPIQPGETGVPVSIVVML